MDAILDPENCDRIDSIKDAERDPRQIRADQIVFTIRFPHQGLSMSRWFQFVATSIRLDLEHDPEFHYRKNAGEGYVVHSCYIRHVQDCKYN